MDKDREELIHIINETDLLPAIVPEVAAAVRKALGWFYYIHPDTARGDIWIWVQKEKFYRREMGAKQIACVAVDTHRAVLICSSSYRVQKGHKQSVTLELSDPECFDKMEQWLDCLQTVNPYRS